jgi:hypothetical protein
MKKLLTYLFLTSALCALVYSCKREAEIELDIDPDLISIDFFTPLNNQDIHVETENHINGLIDANNFLGGWTIQGTEMNTKEILFEFTESSIQNSYFFDFHWTPNLQAQVCIKLNVLDLDQKVVKSDSITVNCI